MRERLGLSVSRLQTSTEASTAMHRSLLSEANYSPIRQRMIWAWFKKLAGGSSEPEHSETELSKFSLPERRREESQTGSYEYGYRRPVRREERRPETGNRLTPGRDRRRSREEEEGEGIEIDLSPIEDVVRSFDWPAETAHHQTFGGYSKGFGGESHTGGAHQTGGHQETGGHHSGLGGHHGGGHHGGGHSESGSGHSGGWGGDSGGGGGGDGGGGGGGGGE